MTNTWYSLSLGDGMMADEPADEIRERFLSMANVPAEAAVFKRLESEGRLHCEAIAYFSPAAAEIAEAFDAEPCEKPARDGLDLLAGNPACWQILFLENRP